MSKYINEHSLSVGYNLDGQNFFDVLNKYHNYIHSYFFSLTDTIGCFPIDTFNVLKSLAESDSYNIPGNLLLNTYNSEERWDELIMIVKDKINLSAVSVLSPLIGAEIKQKYPELEIHLSVRFFDYNPEISCNDLIDQNINIIRNNISVINISDVRSYNDSEFADKIRSIGCKTKYIVNEGCIVNRAENYTKFPEYEEMYCKGSPCRLLCSKLTKEYPWMNLGRALFYKEFIQYWDHKYDILKISTRHSSTDGIFQSLGYWTSNDKTKRLDINELKIDITNNYDLFLEWVNEKSKCTHNCFECQKCKYFYNKFIE